MVMYCHSCSVIVDCATARVYEDWISSVAKTDRNAISLVWRKLVTNKISHAGVPQGSGDDEVSMRFLYLSFIGQICRDIYWCRV